MKKQAKKEFVAIDELRILRCKDDPWSGENFSTPATRREISGEMIVVLGTMKTYNIFRNIVVGYSLNHNDVIVIDASFQDGQSTICDKPWAERIL